MPQPQGTADSEIALAPGMFAQLQDTTKGSVRTYVGPTLINQTGQETPVLYDHQQRIFRECTLRDAIRKMPVALEGDYMVLENPAEGDKHPSRGDPKQDCPKLQMGMKINIPGPSQSALWPGQHADVVPGHNLRSNQYLSCRVYNAEVAAENWKKATIIKAETASAEGESSDESTETKNRQFIAGQRLIIRGDEVSFFIPPTGIEVLADTSENYVREAVTLERLEYCILVDEDGNKRYERGPQVVFPKPTEVFLTDDRSDIPSAGRKFKAIELNPIQGLHIKVIADYNDDGTAVEDDNRTEADKKEGDELFITGRQQPIYFPRPEHSIIRYGERDKQFATAVPPGDGRYVMNRLTGEIKTIDGPDMLLPDPRKEVIVKRVLTENQSDLWYPGNQQAMAYNRGLAMEAESTKTSSLGYVEHAVGSLADTSQRVRGGMDQFERGTSFAKPRTITLDTKFEGVPQICPWTGYAIMVVDKSGNRRVEIGPTTVLLNFDEALEVLTLSMGKPKTTDDLLRTVYLRVVNNKISDIVENVLTADHVPIDLKLSFTVDFEGEPEKWFNIENYVKFLCDHVRSVLKGHIRKHGVKEFWAKGADVIRDIILGESGEGKKRPGMTFEQNGMRITDVEILSIDIKSPRISQMLREAEEEVVANHIDLEREERELDSMARREEIERETLKARHETTEVRSSLSLKSIGAELATELARRNAAMESSKASQLSTVEAEAVNNLEHNADLERQKSKAEQDLSEEADKVDLRTKQLKAETEAAEKRFGAMQKGFHEALLALSNQDALVKIAQAGSVQAMLGGSSLVDLVGQLIGNGQLTDRIKKLAANAVAGEVIDE